IAYALPYQGMFEGAVFSHGTPLFGGPSFTPAAADFPQAMPYHLSLEKARTLLAEAGLDQGFQTTFSYNAGDATIAEPVALLVQEGLAAIGIKVEI
ncbi:ABC transporter substrate-binding protein, partial [Klebsiella pneumoniae]